MVRGILSDVCVVLGVLSMGFGAYRIGLETVLIVAGGVLAAVGCVLEFGRKRQ